MLNLKSSSKFKGLVAGLVVASALTLTQSSVFAANSGVLDIAATVNASLAISVTSNAAIAFDPSVANNAVKVGVLTVTNNGGAAARLSVYQSTGGAPNFSKTGNLTLTHTSVASSNTYSLSFTQTTTGGPAIGGLNAYGASVDLSISGNNYSSKAYDILLTNSALTLPSGRYTDSLVFSLVGL